MPFIGNQPALSYTSFAKQDFTTSATTSYTLDNPVTNANELALFINFVRQEPTTAYSASGTSLTLTSATSATDDMYCVFLGKAVQTVNPPNASVGLSQLSATGTKDATTFLRGDNTFAVAGGTNTPAFEAYSALTQNLVSATDTLVVFGTEAFDTNSNFASNRFTPTVAGKYYVYSSLSMQAVDYTMYNTISKIYKNGSNYKSSPVITNNSALYATPITLSAIIDMNGSSDYVEMYAYMELHSGSVRRLQPEVKGTYFGAYKIIE